MLNLSKFIPNGANSRINYYICTRKGLFDAISVLIVPERDKKDRYEIRRIHS